MSRRAAAAWPRPAAAKKRRTTLIPIAVCIPARNEEAALPALLAGLAPWADARAGQGEVVASGERGLELSGCGDA